jgi:hypothetical protein
MQMQAVLGDQHELSGRSTGHCRKMTEGLKSAVLFDSPRGFEAMTRAARETRTASLSVRTTPTIKALIDKIAETDDRSVCQILERLILRAAEDRGLIVPGKKPHK